MVTGYTPGVAGEPAVGDWVIVSIPGGEQLSVAVTFGMKLGMVVELDVTDCGGAQAVITGASVSGVAAMVTLVVALQPLASDTVKL